MSVRIGGHRSFFLCAEISCLSCELQKARADTSAGTPYRMYSPWRSRTAPQQINFWAKVGRNALANPDLPVDVVRDLLIAKEQPSEAFVFEE